MSHRHFGLRSACSSLACAALVTATVLGTIASAGCSSSQGRPASGAATAILTIPASPTSENTFGVERWELTLGEQGLLVTGYDGPGNAVRGLLLGFTRADLPTELSLEMEDGTGLGQIFTLGPDGEASVRGALTHAQSQFAGQALLDIGVYEAAHAGSGGLRRAARDSEGAREDLRPADLAASLHPEGTSSTDCASEYMSDAYKVAVGTLGCASLVYGGEGAGIVKAIGGAAQVQGKIGNGINLPNCKDAATGFFDLGTCNGTCFQKAENCPSCASGTHLQINSDGSGTCAAGDGGPTSYPCAPDETFVSNPGGKGHTCCKTCKSKSASSSSASSTSGQALGAGAGLGVLDVEGDGTDCPLDSDGGTDGQADGGGAEGSSSASDGSGGGSDGGQGGSTTSTTCDNTEKSAPAP